MRSFAGVVVICLLLLGLLASAGCGGGKGPSPGTSACAGRYVNEENTEDYIEITSDNTFTLVKAGRKTSGSCDVEGGTLLLSAGGFSDTMKVGAGVIMDGDGTKFVKSAGGGQVRAY